MPQIGYHFTAKEKLPSILAAGLLPDIGEHSENMGETQPAVYLHTSLEGAENAIMNWQGDLVDDVEKLTLLNVTIPDDATLLHTTAAFEFVVADRIPPENIVVLTEDVDSITTSLQQFE